METALDVILPAPLSTTAALVEDLAIDDDRNVIQPGDPVLLIVEDDITFARILLDLAHEKNLKALIALRGSAALALAREFKPGAITLDINMPDMAGWTILDRLKYDPATQHIPVHIISGDEDRRRGLALGAMTYLEKSTDRKSLERAFIAIEKSARRQIKKLLLVAADDMRRTNMRQLIEARDLEMFDASSAGEAMGILKQQHLDSVIIDLRLPGIPGNPIGARKLRAAVDPMPLSIILYGKRKLTPKEEVEVRRLQRDMTLRHAQSREHCLI